MRAGALSVSTMLELVAPTSEARRLEIDNANFKLASEIAMLTDVMYTVKNPAFSEEHEQRLILEVNRGYEDCEFRVRQNTLVPYRIQTFPKNVKRPITSVITGPRNTTPKEVVSAFMARFGYEGVEVKQSSATYR